MGVQQSTARNEIQNIVASSINTSTEVNANSSVTASCTTAQSASNLNNCTVVFNTQYCSAIGISNFTGDTKLSENLTESISQNIKSKAKASNIGSSLQIAQISDASNINNFYTSMAISSIKTFNTTCSRGATSAAMQSVDGCVNSTVTFAPQYVKSSATGDCAANTSVNTTAGIELTQIFDLSAEASNVGFDIVSALIAVAIVILAAGVAYKLSHQKLQPQTIKIGANETVVYDSEGKPIVQNVPANSWIIGAYVSTAFFFAFLLVWVLLIVLLGYPPAPFKPRSGCCSAQAKNGLKEGCQPVQLFPWVKCTTPSDGSISSTCLPEWKFYPGCGLMGGKCLDPTYLAAINKYEKVAQACSAFQIWKDPAAGIATCDPGPIRNYTYTDSCVPYETSKNGVKTVTCDVYYNCAQCTGSVQGVLPQNIGLYAQKDILGGFNCSSDLLLNRYWVQGSPCPSPDDSNGNCVTTASGLASNDCQATGYQVAKRKLATYIQRCTDIYTAAEIPLNSQPLNSICGETSILKYLTKCTSDGKCTYTPISTNPVEVAACANDLSGCTDNQYLGDKSVQDNWNSLCDQTYSDYHSTGVAIGATFGVILATLIAVIIACVFKGFQQQEKDYGKYRMPPGTAKAPTKPPGPIIYIALVIIIFAGTILAATTLNSGQQTYDPTIQQDQSSAFWFYIVFMILGTILCLVYIIYNNKKAHDDALIAQSHQQSLNAQPVQLISRKKLEKNQKKQPINESMLSNIKP